MKTFFSKYGHLLRTWGTVLAGNILLAFLVAAFIIPHDIIMGGTTGIGLAISEFTGMDTAFLTALTISAALSGSRINALPSPFPVILRTGQPMFMSIAAGGISEIHPL